MSLKFDYHCVSKEMAPLWFKRYRANVFAVYMVLTSVLFFIYYSHLDLLQRTNDPNRVKNLKTVLELEDLDFVKMTDDLNLQLHDVDLREMEKQVSSKLKRVNPGTAEKSKY